ncbi:MAG: antibiotic biosynthesis monooxygenase family protein [Pseudomonadota bacterium]
MAEESAAGIVVAGSIFLAPGTRDAFLSRSSSAISQARKTPGCLDFCVSADTLQEDRVNIFELWSSRAALDGFRDTGPSDDLVTLIVRADVTEYIVDIG